MAGRGPSALLRGRPPQAPGRPPIAWPPNETGRATPTAASERRGPGCVCPRAWGAGALSCSRATRSSNRSKSSGSGTPRTRGRAGWQIRLTIVFHSSGSTEDLSWNGARVDDGRRGSRRRRGAQQVHIHGSVSGVNVFGTLTEFVFHLIGLVGWTVMCWIFSRLS